MLFGALDELRRSHADLPQKNLVGTIDQRLQITIFRSVLPRGVGEPGPFPISDTLQKSAISQGGL